MDCEKLNRCLDQYLDGTLDEVQAQEAENHLASCPECACLVQMCKDLKAEEGEVPESFSSSWRNRIRKEEKMENQQQKKKSFRSLAAVAVAFLFIVGGTLLTRDKAAGVNQNDQVLTLDGARGTANGAVMYKSAPVAGNSNILMETEEAAPIMMRSMASEDAAASVQQKQPMLIKRVDITIKTMHFDAVVDHVQQSALQAGGRVDYYSQNGDHTVDSMRSASFTLRIPADQLDAFVESAGEEGNITAFSSYVEDAGDQYYDLAARLETQQKKMERLQALLAQATDVSDLIEIESAIADTQYMIDMYTGQMQGIEDDVAFSTVTVYIQETRVVETKEATLGERIVAGLRDMTSSVLTFLEDALIFIVSVLPWLAGVAVIVVIVIVIRKKKNK